MVKKILFVFVLVLPFVMLSQVVKVCDNSSENGNDVNTIKNKCTAKRASKGFQGRNKVTTISSTRSRVIRRKIVNSSSMKSSDKLESVKEEVLRGGTLKLNKFAIEKLPFELVDLKPKFSDCSENTSECFKDKINKHIINHLKYPASSHESGVHGRVVVQFVIDEFGDVIETVARGPKNGEDLKKEAVRIINKLPKFTPGRKRGKLVRVNYVVPIYFKI